MNKYMFTIAVIIAILVTFTACGCQKAEPETAPTTESETTVANTTAATETTAAPETESTEDEVVLGMDEEAAATEETLDYENMPVVTVPEEPAVQGTTEYERYNAMSGTEQQAFVATFDSVEAFFEWYNAAKEEYEASRGDIEISGDEIIDANG